MQRRIKTPHDVVQVLIDIIVANEYKIDIYTQYIKYQNIIKVTIISFYNVYVCYYEMTGTKVEINRYKRKFSSKTKVLVACSFKVHGEYTDFIEIGNIPEKIKFIVL